MIRRASFAALLVLMLSAASVMAATTKVSIYSDHYSVATVNVAMGGSVTWKNTTGKKHNVTADTAFLGSWFWPSTMVKPHKLSAALSFPEAGTFTYHDSTSAALRGTVAVAMKADAAVITNGSNVTLTLGTVTAASPTWHEVQARVNGGAWSTFSTTSAVTAGFHPTSAGTWDFQTRLHHALSGANTGWSPILSVTVLPAD